MFGRIVQRTSLAVQLARGTWAYRSIAGAECAVARAIRYS